MSAPPNAPQVGQDVGPLHQVWWQVLKPAPVLMPNGQPGFEIAFTAPSLAEANAHCLRIPGALIVACVVVYVNPAAPPILRPKPQ